MFLGAGASKAFGNLLTGEILPAILDHLLEDDLFDGYGRPARLRQAFRHMLPKLLPGHAIVSAARLPGITDLLSLLDHAARNSNAMYPGRRADDVATWRQLWEFAVSWVLDPWAEDWNAGALEAFEAWLGILRERGPLTIVTTNYDLGVDRLLFGHPESEADVATFVDLGMNWAAIYQDRVFDRPASPDIAYFKLHGSLNWIRCDHCERVFVNPWASTAHLATKPRDDWANRCYCSHGPLSLVLITPSMVRDVREPHLLGIWRATFDALVAADRWVLVGYSLPSEDIAIRSMLVRARLAAAKRDSRKPPRVEVVQHGRDPATLSRYKAYFPDCRYWARGFRTYLDRESRRIGSRRRS